MTRTTTPSPSNARAPATLDSIMTLLETMNKRLAAVEQTTAELKATFSESHKLMHRQLQQLTNETQKFFRVFSDLPIELVGLILAWLPPRNSIKLRRVNKAFLAAISSRHFAVANLARFQQIARTHDLFTWVRWPANFQDAYASVGPAKNWPDIVINNHSFAALKKLPPLHLFKNARAVKFNHNMCQGRIMPELGTLANLRILSFSTNRLTGLIPEELFHATNLEVLCLDHNRFDGPVSPRISALKKLKTLNLQQCELFGPILEHLTEMEHLEVLNLANNRFTGTVPDDLLNLNNLRELSLQSNMFSGELLIEDGWENMRSLDISANRFSGPVPDFSNMSQLERLHLTDNSFEGSLDLDLDSVPNLNHLCVDERNHPEDPSDMMASLLKGNFEEDDEDEDDDMFYHPHLFGGFPMMPFFNHMVDDSDEESDDYPY